MIKLKWFEPTEFDYPEKLRPGLLLKLDLLRENLKTPITITCDWSDHGHVKGSQHYFGNAVDFRCRGVNAATVLSAARYVGFSGIGLYTIGYFHVDDRLDRAAEWIGVNVGDKIKYIRYTEAMFSFYFKNGEVIKNV